ncbi:MAG: hypothetical protein U1A78_40360 [Polyangia bacterium]
MASWDEIQAHVRASYQLQRDEPRAFQMAFRVDGGTPTAAGAVAPSAGPAAGPAGRKPVAVRSSQGAQPEHTVQTVHGQLLEGLERSLLVLRAEVCGERALSPVVALQHGSKLALGALVLSGGRYQLRCALPTEALLTADLDFALRYLVREAADLRQRTLHRVSMRSDEQGAALGPGLEGVAQLVQHNALVPEPGAAGAPKPPGPVVSTRPLKKPEPR